MVTEKDLKIGVKFFAYKKTNFDEQYQIVKHNGRYCHFCNVKDFNYIFTNYTFSQILNFINDRSWKLIKKHNKYELW